MKQNIPPHDFFKALSDPTRLRIMQVLSQQQSLCVCDITTTLDQPQPTVSRHLNHLKTLGLLSSERKGTWVWYSVNEALADGYKAVIHALPQF